MHSRVVIAVWLALMLLPARVVAQDAESLRRELEQLRRQQEQYQKAIEALSQRLQRLESQPPPATAAAPPVAQAPSRPSSQLTPLTPTDLARPREPFSLSQQRGAGQLLFDIGVSGDFLGNLTQKNVEKASAGTFAGRENRFFPRELELSLFGQVDPYARAEVRIESGEEAPGVETGVGLAEAHLTLLALPWGTQAKLGQMRTRFGWSNERHEHDLPWVDRPDVYRAFFGEEGLVEKGIEATSVPDFLPFYLEVLGGVFNGDNETAFGLGRLRTPLVTGRVRAFFEPTDTTGLQAGVSIANGVTPDRLTSRLLGFDAKFKYRPDGWLHPLLTLGAEAIYSMRQQMNEVVGRATKDRFGWYGFTELQPWRRWAFGGRYDATQYPTMAGFQWAVEPYVSFFPSEFLRFRAAYKHTERTHREGFDLDGGSGRIVDELIFQATFVLGAHPAHGF
jgi:hypothetical protein